MIMIYLFGPTSNLLSVTISDVACLFKVFGLLDTIFGPKSDGRLQYTLEIQELMQIPSPAVSRLDDARKLPQCDLSPLTSWPPSAY